MKTNKRGYEVLNNSKLNKSIAFTRAERQELGLTGLLPHVVASQDTQLVRVMNNIRRQASDIDRYVLLSSLQDHNEKLFYRTIHEYVEEILPIIYTPTVGKACKEFSNIFRRSRGFYITPDDRSEIKSILDNWPEKDIRVIVVTDGQRILGLGDLGSNGMGIPIGKLALYTAFAGIHPNHCLPVMLDVGTNNQKLRNDILYLGYPHKRLKGKDYIDLVDEFIMAVQERYPNALIQFEDFLTPNAYCLLNKYRDRILCFNDDIQGTAAVSLAGVYASNRITGSNFSDLKIMFLGAGSAATGIADLMVSAFQNEGLSKEEAYGRLWFVDVNGLVVSNRTDLLEHNIPYAHDHEPLDFIDAISDIKPNVLIGATGAPATFTKEVIQRMSAINDQPVIFALSNPTDKAECTAEEAYTWSDGKAVFASGSPFPAFSYCDKKFKPGQGNNAYIFPGVGMGVIMCNASTITDELFLTAAKTLAELVSQHDIDEGALYPPLNNIREVSMKIAAAVAAMAYESGLTPDEKPENLEQVISEYMYDPYY